MNRRSSIDRVNRLFISLLFAAVLFMLPCFAYAEEEEIFEDPLMQTEAVSDVEIDDQDELLAQYVENKAAEETGAETGKTAGPRKSRGAKLTGNNKIIYDALKTEIKKIAAGERSSTEILIPLTHIDPSTTRRTAEELGLSSLITGVGLSNAARTKYNESIFDYDVTLITKCLLIDLPYDFYWFDKEAGYTYGFANGYVYNFLGTQMNLNYRDYEYPTVQINFRVSSAYSKSGNTHTYRIDTTKAKLAADAASNAAQIVNANKSRTDYAKVNEYRKAICELTDYDRKASVTDDYGDSWQLIHVFDGNASTKVVCEGYSKAFQLLCDLTSFRSSAVESRTVWGTASGIFSSGPHMWNVLRMDDGKNYLVDVTNCDNGMNGYPDKLFLKGYYDHNEGTYLFVPGSTILSIAAYEYGSDMSKLYSADELALSASDYDASGDAYVQDSHTHTYGSWTWSSRPSISGKCVRKRFCTKCGIPQSETYTTRITGIENKTYTGKYFKPVPVLTFMGVTLTEGVDYTVEYSNNKNVGTASVTITGMGDYPGSVVRTFRILPKKSAVKKLTKAKKAFTVRWKKVSSKMSASRVTGYQIQCATNKGFTKGKKSVKVKGYGKTSKKIKGLKSGKKYYVRVRTYLTTGGKTYYSDWSKAKTVKTR